MSVAGSWGSRDITKPSKAFQLVNLVNVGQYRACSPPERSVMKPKRSFFVVGRIRHVKNLGEQDYDQDFCLARRKGSHLPSAGIT